MRWRSGGVSAVPSGRWHPAEALGRPSMGALVSAGAAVSRRAETDPAIGAIGQAVVVQHHQAWGTAKLKLSRVRAMAPASVVLLLRIGAQVCLTARVTPQVTAWALVNPSR